MPHKTTKEFYDDPKLYDAILYEDHDREPEYFARSASGAKSALYLGAGTGRLLKGLCKKGRRVVGVEYSAKMCDKCREEVPGAEIICLDALKLDLHENFDIVIAPYEFLNHFDAASLERMLKTVHKHLSDKGLFCAQLKNPYQCLEGSTRARLEYVEVTKDGFFEKGYFSRDVFDQRYYDYIERIDLKTNKYDLITLSFYYYFLKDLRAMFKKASLRITGTFGDFSREKFDRDSDVLLIEARKAARQ